MSNFEINSKIVPDKITGGMSFRTCYTKFNFYFPLSYVPIHTSNSSISKALDRYFMSINAQPYDNVTYIEFDYTVHNAILENILYISRTIFTASEIKA